MPLPRFPFSIFRNDIDFTVQMACGNSLYRARTMPAGTLCTMARICQEFISQCQEPLSIEEVPRYPHYREVARARIPQVCDALFAVARTPDGGIEFSVAFYDVGDDTAPALLLTEEQIGDFIEAVRTLVRTERLGSPPATSDCWDS